MSYITLDELRVANPCTSAVWSKEKGADRARLCTTCNKSVHNLSLRTLDEANQLIREAEGKLCISLYHGFNGKVLTADAPRALRALRRKYLIARAKIIGLALAIGGFVTGTITSCYSPVTGGLFGDPFFNPEFSAQLNGQQWNDQNVVQAINDTTVNEIWINATGFDSSSMWIFIDSTERTPGT